MRGELGLPKSASDYQVISALRARAQAEVQDDRSPREIELETRALEAQWNAAEARHPGLASDAREFAEVVATTEDPQDVVDALYSILKRYEVKDEAPAPVRARSQGSRQQREDADLSEPAGGGRTSNDQQEAAFKKHRRTGDIASYILDSGIGKRAGLGRLGGRSEA